MNIFGYNKEHNLPTDKVNAPEGVRREVAPEAATRLQIDTRAMEKANLTGNSMLRFMQLSSEHVGGVVVTGAVSAPQPAVPEQKAADPEEILDEGLKYATYQPQEHPVGYDPVEQERAYEADRQRQAALEAADHQAALRIVSPPVAELSSDYDRLVEATEAGPQVPKVVSDITRLHAETVGEATGQDPVAADMEAQALEMLDQAYKAA